MLEVTLQHVTRKDSKFLTVLGILGSCSYLGALSFYYVAIIKFNLKDTDFVSRKYEAASHLVSNLFPFIACVTLLVSKSFNRLAVTCRISSYPQECIDDPDIECERGANVVRYFRAFVLIPLILITVILVVNMSLVIATVISRKKKSDKWRLRENDTNSCCCGFFSNKRNDLVRTTLQNQVTRISDRNGNPRDIENQSTYESSRRKSVSRSGTSHDPLAFDARRVREMIREESSMAKSEPIILSSSIKLSAEEVVPTHSSLRRSSVASNKESIRSQENNDQEDEGFFFIMIYSRPHVKSLRQRNPEYSWIKAFLIVFKAGGDNDTAGGQNQEYTVIDETGIDAPRLPEAERLRRQELVRKDYMRKRGTITTSNSNKETEMPGKVHDIVTIAKVPTKCNLQE